MDTEHFFQILTTSIASDWHLHRHRKNNGYIFTYKTDLSVCFEVGVDRNEYEFNEPWAVLINGEYGVPQRRSLLNLKYNGHCFLTTQVLYLNRGAYCPLIYANSNEVPAGIHHILRNIVSLKTNAVDCYDNNLLRGQLVVSQRDWPDDWN